MPKNTLFYGTMMLKMGDADAHGRRRNQLHRRCAASGAADHQGQAPGIKTVSSCFLMEVHGQEVRRRRRDGLRRLRREHRPDAASSWPDIAIASAQTGKALLGIDPRVAMLSFSTKGCAKHENVDQGCRNAAKHGA